MASSFLRSLDHTQRRSTVGRTPLDEWSARRRDLTWQYTTLTTDKHLCPGGIRTHDLRRRAAADLRLRHTLSSAQIKGRVKLYLYCSSGPIWPVLKWALPFYLLPVLWMDVGVMRIRSELTVSWLWPRRLLSFGKLLRTVGASVPMSQRIVLAPSYPINWASKIPCNASIYLPDSPVSYRRTLINQIGLCY